MTMAKLTKKRKEAKDKIEIGKEYSLQDASCLLKEITFTQNLMLQLILMSGWVLIPGKPIRW